MSEQYLRKLSVIVAQADGTGLELAEFRCKFKVQRGDIQTPNSLDLRIYNLSDNTRNKIASKEFTQVAIKAGFPGNFGLIFQGTIKQSRKGRVDQKDSYVDITAADGDEAYHFATISATIPAGTKPGGIADAILNAMKAHGITKGYQPNFPQNGCVRGKVLYGMARDAARDFAWAQNCKWSIQDGALTFIPYTSYIPGQIIPVITPSTGLIGVPEQTQQGLNIRVLLNPNIKVGQLIKLDSTDINKLRFDLSTDKLTLSNNLFLNGRVLNTPNPDGLYYVMVANHTGDSRGTEWYTDVICLAVDATVPLDAAAVALTAVSGESIPRY
jgi:hypothetical protein